MNLLIVDDEKMIRQGLSFFIGQLGGNYRVVGECVDGQEALVFCRKGSPSVDVVITDVRMDNMDGLTLLRMLKEITPPIRSVVISSYGEFDYVRRALREGAEDYLLKPVDKQELQRVLEKIETGAIAEAAVAPSPIVPPHLRNVMQDTILNGLFEKALGSLKEGEAYILKEFGASDGSHRYAAAGLVVDESPNDMLSARDRTLFHYFFRKASEEMLAEYPIDGVVMQSKEGTVRFLFFMPIAEFSESRDPVEAVIFPFLEALLGVVRSHVSYPLTIAVSGTQERLADINQLNEQLHETLRARLILGTDKVITYRSLGRLSQYWNVRKDTFRQLVASVHSEAPDRLNHEVKGFFGDMLKAELLPGSSLELIVRLLMRVSTMMEEMGVSPEAAELTDWLSIGKELEMCPTWELLQSYTLSRLTRASVAIQEHRVQQKPRFIIDAVEYIGFHYASDISLREVAELNAMNPTYFSEQFKKHMHITFIDYITKVRLDKAKVRLVKSDEPVYEICEQVGYSTAAHFSKVFKKWIGCTPLEFRERERVKT
ncbi:response regulator transcription factor [Cohnella silvisoli]|uniref:Response regulator n=1 Tax=Cohnella silvisoli TaxID=2873699 RepID=A0ABV1L231_9BACL|nr:response regulator [Cohnella silvisoli]MCD9025719.1 response regulator [Cohnella silvisoli]